MPYHGYTIDDMAAIADARGCSYGVIQAHLEFGAPWPNLRKSVKWPKDSMHRGEMQLDSHGREISLPAPDPAQPVPKKQKSAQMPVCTVCGQKTPSAEIARVTYKQGTARKFTCRLVGSICAVCSSRLLPKKRPTNEEIYPRHDDEGNKLDCRRTARCFRCRAFYPRAEGGTVFAEKAEMQHTLLAGYLCPDCLPVWLEETKKSGTPN